MYSKVLGDFGIRRARRSGRAPGNRWVAEVYDSVAERFYRERVDPNSHFEEFLWPVLAERLGEVRNLLVADIGCGPGVMAHKLRMMGAQVIGGDLSAGMIKLAKKYYAKDGVASHGSLRFYIGPAWEVPLESATADLVVASYVLNHLGQRELEATLKEAHRVLRVGGRMVVMDAHPNRNQAYYRAGGGRQSRYPSGWYKEGWPELGAKLIPVYYRHYKDWLDVCEGIGFKQVSMFAPTSKDHQFSGLSDSLRRHYSENRILIIDLVK